MIFAPLAAMALVVTVSAGPIHDADPTALQLTAREKNAAMRPLVEQVTECIAGRVVGDTRYDTKAAAGMLGDLIVESVPPCLKPVRAMIEAYDRYYGEGSGEAFFMGPYLDVLPRAVTERRRSENTGDAAGGAGAPH
jgi:hypothetical protein